MLRKIVLLGALAFCLLNVNALSLNKLSKSGSSEEKQDKDKEILESLKEFVRIVDKYNLNVSIIGSHKKYGSGGWVKESLSIAMHMPTNDELLTEASLDDAKQDKYLKKMERLGTKEHVGAKTRVIQIKDGQDELVDEQSINSQFLIDSPSHEILTTYTKGKQGFSISENETSEIIHNYVIKNPSPEGIKNVQIITANVNIEETDVSKDFPTDVLDEIKRILPKLWLSMDDDTIMARLLVNYLDKKFDQNFQVMTGIDNFATGGIKYANLGVGNSNIVVFMFS